jgi:hypothetical protein
MIVVTWMTIQYREPQGPQGSPEPLAKWPTTQSHTVGYLRSHFKADFVGVIWGDSQRNFASNCVLGLLFSALVGFQAA